MYASFMCRRHWMWAVGWAFALESIAAAWLFARVFSLSGNYSALAIAYLGHVGYGIPLGLMVWKWDRTRSELRRFQEATEWVAAALVYLIAAWWLCSPQNVRHDRAGLNAALVVEGSRLNPGWL